MIDSARPDRRGGAEAPSRVAAREDRGRQVAAETAVDRSRMVSGFAPPLKSGFRDLGVHSGKSDAGRVRLMIRVGCALSVRAGTCSCSAADFPAGHYRLEGSDQLSVSSSDELTGKRTRLYSSPSRGQ